MALGDHFRSGTPEHALVRKVSRVCALTCLVLAASFVVDALSFRFIDFPCSVEVRDGHLEGRVPRGVGEAHADLLLAHVPPHTSGGACLHRSLSDGEAVDVGRFEVAVRGTDVVLEGDTLRPGEVGSRVETDHLRPLHPWWWVRWTIEVSNEGLVEGIRSIRTGETFPFDGPVLVAAGGYTGETRLNVVTAVLFGLCLTTWLALTASWLAFRLVWWVGG